MATDQRPKIAHQVTGIPNDKTALLYQPKIGRVNPSSKSAVT